MNCGSDTEHPEQSIDNRQQRIMEQKDFEDNFMNFVGSKRYIICLMAHF